MNGLPKTQRLSAPEHGLSREDVNRNALDVIERLTEAGYEAVLVGGCVRDLLLGRQPKDFDVATDATPEEVKRAIRRARLIGRRFRIAHVRYGREIIEVSTFRTGQIEEEDERRHADSGLILRDNVWGSMDEDAFRRDFTINALYYDPETESVIDFVGGLKDLEERRLRFIGDPEVRLREDPVRILRAIRFYAKLDFDLDTVIVAAIPETAELLRAIPPARLFDEICKLFVSGNALGAWDYIAATPLRHVLFPASPPDDTLIRRAMHNTDLRIEAEKPVTPGFLLAVLLWADYQARVQQHEAGHKPSEARAIAAGEVLDAQQQSIAIPRRFSQFIRDIWMLQPRLEARRPRHIPLLLEHERFRAAYDFLVLRGESGEGVAEIAHWWTRLQDCSPHERDDMIEALRNLPAETEEQEPRKRRRRRRKTADS